MWGNWAIALLLTLSARWDGPGAVVSWQQPAGVHTTCLYRYYGAEWPAAICWNDLPAGPQSVALPGELQHLAYVAALGDRYELRFEDVIVGDVVLGEATVFRVHLPIVQSGAAPPDRRVRLPIVRG